MIDYRYVGLPTACDQIANDRMLLSSAELSEFQDLFSENLHDDDLAGGYEPEPINMLHVMSVDEMADTFGMGDDY